MRRYRNRFKFRPEREIDPLSKRYAFGVSTTFKRLLIATGVIALALIVGVYTRDRLGIQLDVESVRRFAESLGAAGPALFVLVVAGRSFLALPSQIVLIAAGLCFGTVMGAFIGGAGLMMSGVGLFLMTRYAGRQSLEKRLGSRGRHLLSFATHRSGAATLAVACGYPIMPLSPVQAAAGLTPMSLGYFVPAAFAGGSVRAALFANLGNSLLDAGWTNFLYAGALFVIIACLPLAFPQGRRWLRETLTPPHDAGKDQAKDKEDSNLP